MRYQASPRPPAARSSRA